MTADEASSVATSLERPERTIDVRGIATHMFEAGASSSPPLLYLHGTYLGNLWLEFHTTLAQQFHVFAPDTPGFGLTARPDWMRDMSDYVLYFCDLLDTLGIEKATLVGHSLGGWMAAELAVWYPERVEKLVLSNAAGIRVKGSPIADLFAMNAQEVMLACFDDFSAAAPLMPAEMNVDYLIGQYRQLTTLASLAWNPSYDPKLERRLARITCPTLIVWGEHDRLIPPVYAEAFQCAIAGSEVVMLSGTGHMPMFEKPQEWSAAIVDFLRK
ncbi:MAG TPA: alpha/beta hydrolase [Ktedonobacteraceae bacterium]|nr:alpha/beta hydrolase [Ktedonobacteraceae bacterium]